MKVIVNTSTFKENDSDKITGVINELVESISKNNQSIEFTILKPMGTNGKKSFTKENIKVYCYRYFWVNRYQNFGEIGLKPSLQKNYFNIFKLLFFLISQYFSLEKLVKKTNPDLIYAHWFFPQAIITFLVARKYHVKFMFTSHGSDVQLLNTLGPVGRLIVRKVTEKAYKYTAVSNLTMQEINKNFSTKELKKHDYLTIPMGIDEKYFNIKKSNTFNNDNLLKMVYVGRLIDYKGVDLLIKSLSLFKSREKKFKLDIFGTGILESSLKQMVKNLGLENNITFHGFKSFNDKLSYIKYADLFVVPSIYKKTQLEGGPLTLIEAMASKTLCLVSDSIGFITHCNENNSIIFRSGDIEDLELKLNQFTEMDREKLNKIRDEGFKTANYFKFLNIGKLHSEFLFR
tara:strand:+ start:334 stop:1539 length:1206 start_codon:yes stop_codon:yes gene_type:complete